MSSEHISDRGAAVMNDGSGNRSVVEFWRPIMWSAVFGGMVAALGIQLVLSLFGVGIGAAMVNPYADAGDTSNGGGIMAVVFTIVTGIISFGFGGFIAGHMSGVLRTGSGALHGMLAWAAAAVFGVTLAVLGGSTTVGGAATGVAAAGSSYAQNNPSAVADTVRGADGEIRRVDADTRAALEADAREAAARVAEAVARVSLVTAIAFLLSALAAAGGGTLARRSAVHKHDARAPSRLHPAI